MPWESRTVMNQREQFVEEAAESRNFSDLCRRYGISRKTGYKWVQRAQAGAPLEDQSRRPGHPFGQTPAEVEEKILAVRSDNPAWGGLKIKAELERRGETGIPSARTCGAILKRNGCISPEESQKHQPYQCFERDRCNALWQTDFKGDFLLGDSSRCFPLDILDDRSRFCIRTEPKPAASGIKETFLNAFRSMACRIQSSLTTVRNSLDSEADIRSLNVGSWTWTFCPSTAVSVTLKPREKLSGSTGP